MSIETGRVEVTDESRQEFLCESHEMLRSLFDDVNTPTDRTPTDRSLDDLMSFLAKAAPAVIAFFRGDPTAAADILGEQITSVLRPDSDLGAQIRSVEEQLSSIEAKIDAAMLSRFKSGAREFRDALRAPRGAYREGLLFSARSKLADVAELPVGISVGGVSSETLAAAACLLVSKIVTLFGDAKASLRYAAQALMLDPLWAQAHVPAGLVVSVGGIGLERLHIEHAGAVAREQARHHDFFGTKVGIRAAQGGALLVGIMGRSLPAASHTIRTGETELQRLETNEAQAQARAEAVKQVHVDFQRRFVEHIRNSARERIGILDSY